jgi:hypothetical protein
LNSSIAVEQSLTGIEDPTTASHYIGALIGVKGVPKNFTSSLSRDELKPHIHRHYQFEPEELDRLMGLPTITPLCYIFKRLRQRAAKKTT